MVTIATLSDPANLVHGPPIGRAGKTRDLPGVVTGQAALLPALGFMLRKT
jgi:hypothetical protein